MGGEAYVQFKPDLIDDEGNVASEDTTKFLKSYIERFAAFAARLAD
jgi:chromate reductase